ncbi:2-hydroxycarboxylate transporter family protein [Clostridium sp. D2Q-11]|uniref:2-hydroxycarboxylate transporter family protein n=1 Tax=Anaeromonas frigoriresistens TaxID=2683708 RepID=A0A942UTQ9_9FIRM|nr:2-hydroxycarboxylate transporter family protein [Anaeromonas frigoriresistens]MBS4538408.1 2-hydroxycarboxylate transporter family protein [Anaeromonas frigoriresistens]
MEGTKGINNGQKFKLFGMPVHVFAIFAIVIIAGMATGSLSTDLAGGFAVLFLLGIVFGEIGDRIPIWKEYIGGGSILAFLGAAYLVYKGILPEKYVDSVVVFMDDSDFLTLFISVLITGSILAVNRKLLIRSFIGYVPAILGGLAFAFLFGGIAGLIVGVPFKEIAIKYVLPIMGGGNGAGAIPLSEIWEEVTGQPRDAYYSFAISILTIANIVAIFIGAILNKIGQMRPNLTGNGEELIRNSKALLTDEDNKETKTTFRDVAAGLILATTFYSLGRLFSKALLPSIGGVVIHHFAYMVIFVAIFNALGLIPEELRSGAKKLQKFFTGQFIWVIMAGVGIAFTDLGELVAAITLSNVFIAAFVVIGAVLGSAIVGYFVGFFPIDTAVTAGLCMANRGGSGDIAVLGASKRMDLISYGQISSRIGGGMVLVIGSIVFGLIF